MHPSLSLLVSASDDMSCKLWDWDKVPSEHSAVSMHLSAKLWVHAAGQKLALLPVAYITSDA